jgi:hypothetical protein
VDPRSGAADLTEAERGQWKKLFAAINAAINTALK